MRETIYCLEQIRKEYNRQMVLKIDILKIYQGEILALVGPSGAGKSTLLRMLNFLEPPTQGQVWFSGVDIRDGIDIPIALRRRVTTVFQRPLLLNRSVRANVAYGLRIRKQKAVADKTENALMQVGLDDIAGRSARTLSGGEAQRVALARAIVLTPDVLLLDEPTANLDPYNVSKIEEVVVELNRAQKTTIVLVTHNIFQARRLAHRVVLLLDGEVIEVKSVDEFFNNPQDPRTAAFVRGEMVY